MHSHRIHEYSASRKPGFGESLRFWIRLGFISFGGPAGQIAIMHAYLVEKKRWISEKKFLHALNYCMLLPGPEAQQLATYTGWLLNGITGGIAAGLLFILPSVVVLSALSVSYVLYGRIALVESVFTGLKPAVLAIILAALLKIGRRALRTSEHRIIALLSFLVIFFFRNAFPLVVLGALLAGLLIPILRKKTVAKQEEESEEYTEEAYYLHSNTFLPHTQFRWRRLFFLIAAFCLLWIIPLAGFYFLSPDFMFWKRLILFFTQTAFITFGGAYAVLPYVAQISVTKMQWLTRANMVDGLALGETTPGPLVMVLAFVGFMAGYNTFGQSVTMGLSALLITTYYTFLPCFLLVFAGGPLIEKTQKNTLMQQLLSYITAAVSGVILNLALYFGEGVLFREGTGISQLDWLSLVWAGITFFALFRLRIGMIPWIGVSAVFGIVVYLLGIL